MSAPSTSASARDLEIIGDAIDEGVWPGFPLNDIISLMSFIVNIIKGSEWNAESEFDNSVDKTQFRNYDEACERVKAFYKEQHGKFLLLYFPQCLIAPIEKQTVEYNLRARYDFKNKRRARMGVWEAIELLNTVVDDSDPDVGLFCSTASWSSS